MKLIRQASFNLAFFLAAVSVTGTRSDEKAKAFAKHASVKINSSPGRKVFHTKEVLGNLFTKIQASMTRTNPSVEGGHPIISVHQENESGVPSKSIQQLQDEPIRRLSNDLYWGQVYDDLSFDSTLGETYFGHRVSISSNGLTIAVSGIGTNTDGKFYSKVKVYIDAGGNWVQHGTDIEDITLFSDFWTDARADVSLSGDGSKLAIANVHKNARASLGITASGGTVKVYQYSSDWSVAASAYDADAGKGGHLIGLKVSLNNNGSALAYSVLYHDVGSDDNDAGQVNVCYLSTGTYECDEVAVGVPGDLAGTSVMIAGTTPCLIYGSSKANSTGTATILCETSGSWSGTNWTERDTLSGEADFDEFGFSVGITSDAEYVAVGARFNDHVDNGKSKKNAGHVRVYKKGNANDYEQLGSDIDGERGENEMGTNVYYDGDYSGSSIGLSDVDENDIIKVVIGAPNNKGNSNEDYYGYGGHVRLYQCNVIACSDWEQLKEDIDSQHENDRSAGKSVGMSTNGLRVIVGIPEHAETTPGSNIFEGRARVYEIKVETEEPSSAPSETPSLSSNPSSAPSETPSLSSNPSSAPSDTPSLSSNPSSAPSETPSLTPSLIPSLSASPSNQPSAIRERYFQINSLFEEFDQTRTWCVTDTDGATGVTSKLVMRPCKSRSHHQVMFQNEFGELQFIPGPFRSGNAKCIVSNSGSKVYLNTCASSAVIADTHKWNIADTNDNGSIRQSKNGNIFLLGFDTTRKFSRLRNYKEGSFNTALYKWKLRYGYNVDKYDAPFYGHTLCLQNLGVPSPALSDKSYLSDVDVSDVNSNGSPSILREKGLIMQGVENYKFEWIIRSKRVEVFDSSLAIDPLYGNCVKYGERIYLQGNQRAAVFLKKDGTVVQIPGISFTDADFEWTVRSTDTDIVDPKAEECMAANDAIYLKNENLYLQINAGLTVVVDSAGGNDYTKWSAQLEPFQIP